MTPPSIVARHARIEEVLDAFGDDLAADRAAYRGHVYRVFHFGRALAPTVPVRDEKMALAAVFHDLGIWSDRTVDYLPPSVRRLRTYLEEHGRTGQADELVRMVEMHHKLTPYRGEHAAIVEAFRRADLVDVTFGLVRFGLPSAWIGEVQAAFAEAGFHARIARALGGWALRHPLRPLPMLRW